MKKARDPSRELDLRKDELDVEKERDFGVPGKQTVTGFMAGFGDDSFSQVPGKMSIASLMADLPSQIFAKRESGGAGKLGSPAVLRQLSQSTGVPLPKGLLEAAERLLGTDLSEVKVHNTSAADEAASAIGARAFAIGPNLFFRRGAYAPDTERGQRLLIHELTHAAQWIRGDISSEAPRGGDFAVAEAGHALEREADEAANLFDAFDWRSDRQVNLPLGEQARPMAPAPAQGGFILRDEGDGLEGQECVGEPTSVPEGGQEVNRPGRVNWDGDPRVRLRGSDSTSDENIIGELEYNARVQVLKRMPGDWFFVSTETGTLGYVAAAYIWTDMPEPNAQLHKVEAGTDGTAIAIAERYYGEHADDWGQDLRFYVNVLAWANDIEVPDSTDGWRSVHFEAGRNVWVPSHQFARSLVGVVNSGSYSYNTLDAVGMAEFVERIGELWDDFAHAISLSGQYIPQALQDGFFDGLRRALRALIEMLLIAAVIMAISTAIGAAIGAIAGGGVGAAPGAAAGFEVGMILLEWLGLAFLVVWLADALVSVGSALGGFLTGVWNARGDESALDAAAQDLANALGLLLRTLIEAVVMFAAARGLGAALRNLRGTKFGEAMGESAMGRWLGERVANNSQSGATPRGVVRSVRERGQGERGQGETGTGERGQGETGTGERGQGETGTGERGQGETGTGERGTGERATGREPVTFTNRTAGELVRASEGRAGNGNSSGHAGDHIPPEGATPAEVMAHSQRRPTKQNTTVWRNRRHALQDLRNVLNNNAQRVADIPNGDGLFLRERITVRQGYNSQNGQTPTEVSFMEVTLYIDRLADGTLVLIHFTPRLSGL